jgi:hypothetical protein
MHLYVLHASCTDFPHTFIEIFTSLETLNQFVANHPNIVVREITSHDANPV